MEEGARRALVRDFPYGAFFTTDADLITVLAMLICIGTPTPGSEDVEIPSDAWTIRRHKSAWCLNVRGERVVGRQLLYLAWSLYPSALPFATSSCPVPVPAPMRMLCSAAIAAVKLRRDGGRDGADREQILKTVATRELPDRERGFRPRHTAGTSRRYASRLRDGYRGAAATRRIR
jgi:hypothetical protein